jgi:plastocyanin
MKIDAVPGMKTSITLKPTKTGTFQSDPNLRLQCTQLCGTSHSRMRIPVRVVSQEEFDDWVSAQAKPVPSGTPSGPSTEIMITAKNVKFDQPALTVPSGSTAKLTVHNEDSGVIHNWALYKDKSAAAAGEAPLASTPLEAGPVTQSLTFVAPASGEYFFRCDVHPATMSGTFSVR